MMSLLSALPFLAALLLTFYFWPNQNSHRIAFLLRCSLAGGLALGISSCSFFVSLAVCGSPSKATVLDILFYVVLNAVLLFKLRNQLSKFQPVSDPKPGKRSRFDTLLATTFYVVAALAVVNFVLSSLTLPHGNWDAWAIWNLRARFIFRGGEHWANAFSQLLFWSHPDYPLLIPMNVARVWTYLGHESTMIPWAIAMFFTFATVGLMISAISVLRDKNQALLAALVLLGSVYFIRYGTWQYADVPFGYFVLATVILWSLQSSLDNSNFKLLSLAGMMAGFATWTKNEGFLFLVSLVIARFVICFRTSGLKSFYKEIRAFILGLFPILAVVLYFKFHLAPPTDLMTKDLTSVFNKMVDLTRYLQVAKAFFVEFIFLGNGFVFILMIYFFLLGIHPRAVEKPIRMTISITLCLMLLGYVLIYVTSPHDLNFHLTYSLRRLFIQIWPTAIFAFFLTVKTLDQAPVTSQI